MSNLNIIIGREFKERVGKKSFIITTILMPIVMIAIMAAPTLIMMFNTPSKSHIVVEDRSGIILPALVLEAQGSEYLEIIPSSEPVDSLMKNEKYDGVLVIGEDIVNNPNNATLYTHEQSGNIEVEKDVTHVIEKAVSDARLKAYNIENIDQIVKDSQVSVFLKTVRVLDDGSEKDTSSGVSMMLGLVMDFILYMFLLMYGQMVMTSIIEEKNNRVLELIVTSVRPVQLMMGKIIGVGLVAVLQIVIWAVLVCSFVGYVMPMLIPADVASQVAMANAGTFDASTATIDPDMIQALSMFSSIGFIAKMFLYMALYLIGGFLFYAAIFAAIGSAVDNVQDASQLTTFATMPIILGIVFSMVVINDPNGQLAFWLSMIPFTSPMVMMMRVPFEIPDWQIWVSLVVLFASFAFMAWVAGKIYRVGIFMYGKKPTIKDLIRWARYK